MVLVHCLMLVPTIKLIAFFEAFCCLRKLSIIIKLSTLRYVFTYIQSLQLECMEWNRLLEPVWLIQFHLRKHKWSIFPPIFLKSENNQAIRALRWQMVQKPLALNLDQKVATAWVVLRCVNSRNCLTTAEEYDIRINQTQVSFSGSVLY